MATQSSSLKVVRLNDLTSAEAAISPIAYVFLILKLADDE